jgi:hypothetical protein
VSACPTPVDVLRFGNNLLAREVLDGQEVGFTLEARNLLAQRFGTGFERSISLTEALRADHTI